MTLQEFPNGYRKGNDHQTYGADVICPCSHEKGYGCTRIDGHDGDHQAGVGHGKYVASWSDTDKGHREDKYGYGR